MPSESVYIFIILISVIKKTLLGIAENVFSFYIFATEDGGLLG
jgi:hypothetical protein